MKATQLAWLKKIVSIILVVLFLGVLVSCKAKNESAVKTQATVSSETTSMPKTVSATPVSARYSNTWNFENEKRFTYALTINLWDPITGAKGGSTPHPANSNDVLGSAFKFDPATDLAIPAQFVVKYNTPYFDSSISVSALFVHDYFDMVGNTGPYVGLGTAPTYEDKRIGVEEFYSDGPKYRNFSSENGWGYGESEGFGVKWNSMTNGQLGQFNLFIIVHDYFSPATPEGDKALLDYVTIRPIRSRAKEQAAEDVFVDAEGSEKDMYSAVGLTLSGIVVSP